MNRGYNDSQYSDSIKLSNFNQAGLEQAQHNYFMKYAGSGISQINNAQRTTKRVETNVVSTENKGFSKIKNTQNQVLRQLKQEYQILRNLPIQDKMDLKAKPKRQVPSDYSSSIDDRSDMSSSKRSGNKKVSREAQILALEKKQLQIVISNSLKKIQQLLQNQMGLKKTIHQLRLQVQGKGGVNSEYQIQIRNFKKNEKELKQTIDSIKLESQRKNAAIKQLGQKNAFLEGEKSRRDNQYRSYFDDQRKIDDQLRKEKDRSMGLELQYKRMQMELQIYQKDKTAQIGRLTRQLQQRDQAPERDAQTIRKLREQIKTKDQKVETLIEQIQILRGQIARPISPPQDNNRKALQQLVRQMKAKSQLSAKDNNEAIFRALADKLGGRKEQVLKSQVSSLRVQLQTIRRNSAVSDFEMNPNQEAELKSKIRELQKVIDDQKRQKKTLIQQIDKLRTKRDEIYEECESHRRKIKQYKQTEQSLLIEIQQLSNFKIQLEQSQMQNQQIKQKLQTILSGHHNIQGIKFGNVQNGDDRVLRRKIDQLSFALNKAHEQKVFNESILKESLTKQMQRLAEDLSRYKSLLKSKQDQLSRSTMQLRNEIEAKNKQIQNLNMRFEQLDKRNRETFQDSRGNYQSLLKTQVTKHYAQLQSMNQKIIEMTKTNEIFTCKTQYYAQIQREVNQLRRLTKNHKRTNQAVDHLWQIKQAEYDNVNQILSSVRN